MPTPPQVRPSSGPLGSRVLLRALGTRPLLLHSRPGLLAARLEETGISTRRHLPRTIDFLRLDMRDYCSEEHRVFVQTGAGEEPV